MAGVIDAPSPMPIRSMEAGISCDIAQLQFMAEIADRAAGLADRLIGPEPETAGTSTAPPQDQPSLLDRLSAQHDARSNVCKRLNSSLDRLEKAI